MNIRNSISLTDQMTPVLRSVLKALDSTLRVMDMVDKKASTGAQSKAYKQAEKDIQRANNALIKMGNYAELSNSKVQRSTEKSIKQMNLLEVAALGVSKAMSKIGDTPMGSTITSKATSVKNFLSSPFAAMQTKGTQMMDMSTRLGGSKLQGLAGGALKSLGDIGSGASTIFSAIGSAASTAFSVVKNSFSQMGTAAGNAFNRVKTSAAVAWMGVNAGIEVIQKVMQALSSLTQMTDKVISDMAKLDLQNYSSITTSQAYGLAYRAAQASRSDLSTTSTLASKISMSGVYGKGEGSLASSINMAETIQKALVLGGGTQEENSRALLQLSQGLSSGRLQGDELRSIREQSPYLAEMLAEGLAKVDSAFEGVTSGDLKTLGAEGKLTSDVVIKAFEAMEEQIDKTFDEKAPKTWAQGVTSIMNTVKFFMGILQQMEGGPLEKINNLVWQISDYLRSEDGLRIMAGLATAIQIIGDVLSFVLKIALNVVSWLIDNSYVLVAAFVVLGAVALVAGTQALFAWLSATWPLLLTIAIIAILIKVLLDMGFTFGDITGAICGGIMVIISFFKNLGLAVWGIIKGCWAVLQGLWTNTGLAFQNVGLGIKSFFAGILSDVLGFVSQIAAALNKLPFIDFDYSGISNAATYWADQQAQANTDIEANKAAMVDLGKAYDDAYNSVGAFKEGWASDAFDSGFEWGSNIINSIGEKALNITDAFKDSEIMAGSVSVDGGKLDSVDSIGSDVDISDEDVRLLRDMAARDYLLQLQTITPVANVTFGDVRETADVNKIVEVIEQMVDEQMATALVS